MKEHYGYWYCLSKVKGLGPLRIKTLLLVFKTPEEVYKLSEKQLLCIKGIDDKIAKALMDSKNNLDKCINFMGSELERAERNKSKLILLSDNKYPSILKETNACPPILYVKGDFGTLERLNKTISIVGTREVSDYGKDAAYNIAKKLINDNYAIVSGMAKGTDSTAHYGALDANGVTVAVLGCGVDVVYPQESQEIYNQLLQRGLVISEYPFGTRPNDINLKRRNKITVGLSSAVVIIETSEKGGTMNAVRAASEQKKKVFVLEPKEINKNNSGNVKLIHEGKVIPINLDNAISRIKQELL